MGTTINQLTATDAVVAGDQVPVYTQNNGDTRKAAMSVLQAYMQANLNFSTSVEKTTYSSPATGTTVTLTSDGSNIRLIITPAATIATLTITLPAISTLVDHQKIIVSSSQIITTLTVNGNDAGAVNGAPTTIAAANGYFTLEYDAVTTNWIRIG